MHREYFNIKDNCRKGLLKYLAEAISYIPDLEDPHILDVGCGSGVPTLFLAEIYKGKIMAIDPDPLAMKCLEEKIAHANLSERISQITDSFFNIHFEESMFDLIIAEGFLNVVGFDTGFERLISKLKKNRYMIIHDERKDQERKIRFIESNGCRVITSFVLDDRIWWDDYYRCLEREIESIRGLRIMDHFKTDKKELRLFKQNPLSFTSQYFVVEKQ